LINILTDSSLYEVLPMLALVSCAMRKHMKLGSLNDTASSALGSKLDNAWHLTPGQPFILGFKKTYVSLKSLREKWNQHTNQM